MVPPNKAIIRDYGFAHESRIHKQGVLKDSWTYEPYPPELVDNKRRLTIGKQSGKGIIKHKIMEITGKAPTAEVLTKTVAKIKKIYAKGRRAHTKRGRNQKNTSITQATPRIGSSLNIDHTKFQINNYSKS